jgi:hypothetical protein
MTVLVFKVLLDSFQLLWESHVFPHDPLHIYRAAEILRQAVFIAGAVALVTSSISSVSVLVVTRNFLKYLRDQKK